MSRLTVAVAVTGGAGAPGGRSPERPGLLALLQRMIEACPEECRRFVELTLQPLERYDATTGSELLRTLSVYLRCDGSMDRTASALILHRHTVRYRLGRIAELTSQDPYTTGGREALGLAVKLRALLGA